ncbi:MAG: integrin alpha [Oligoflexia bacterium]|nr:integrin alpha [Oligoflexia bacterium]
MRLIFSVLVLFSVPAFADDCQLLQTIPQTSTLLYSTALDNSHSRYFVSRDSQVVRLFEVSRQISLQITERFSVPVPADAELSISFSDQDLVLSTWKPVTVSGDNQTPPSLSHISFYNLQTGQPNLTRNFADTAADILPAKLPNAPFYASQWPYSSWQAQLCGGSTAPNAQQGRITAALGDRILVAHGGEQLNYCNPDPNYYLYHLLPDGTPTTSIQSSEHCPSCAYWWTAADPGIQVFQSDGASIPGEITRIAFPEVLIPEDPLDPESNPTPSAIFRLGNITALRTDPSGTGFVMAIDASTVSGSPRDFGGMLFFDAEGHFYSFGSTFVSDSHLGEKGSIALIGYSSEGAPIYAAGSSRNVSWPQVPQSLLRNHSEAGRVEYYDGLGERRDIEFGDNDNDRFGTAVTGLGDLNDDGIPDALIGAPGGRYANISSSYAVEENAPHGKMYQFRSTAQADFGKQVAAVSTDSSGRADIAIIASRDNLYIYDLISCRDNLSPASAWRDLLRALIPQILPQVEAIVPNPSGTPPIITNKLNPLHPQLFQLSTQMTELNDVLVSDPNLIPSNEQVRAADLGRATRALNLNMNIRDFDYHYLKDLERQLKSLGRQCPPKKRKLPARRLSTACKQYLAMERKIKRIKAERKNSIKQIGNSKSIILDNLRQIQNELNSTNS